MKLVFQGIVEAGDSYRCELEPKNGSVRIAGRDVVQEVQEHLEGKRRGSQVYTAIYRGSSAITMLGALRISQGWGYSEYTPMEADSLFVGPHDLIGLILQHVGEEVTVWFADESFNIFDDLTIIDEAPKMLPANVQIWNGQEKFVKHGESWATEGKPLIVATYATGHMIRSEPSAT